MADRRGRPAARAAAAGAAYFALAFGAGFLLGTLRVLVLAPWLGETGAVLLELPVMLAISWIACRWLIARLDIAPDLAPRLIMGGVAFLLLMAAETGLSVLAFGRSLAEHLLHYREVPALLGLAAQIAFAAFPAIQRRRDTAAA